MREVAESLLPLAGPTPASRSDPLRGRDALASGDAVRDELLLSARLFHGSDLLAPIEPGDRERSSPSRTAHELGLKARSW